MLLLTIVILLLLLFYLYWNYVRPAKTIYDSLRKQGVPAEPFIPLIGQGSEIRRYREEGRLLEYHKKLTARHGSIYLFGLGPFPRLLIQDPNLVTDLLGRHQSEKFFKPEDLAFRLKPLIGVHNLLVSNGSEHERARQMLNPAFHFDKLQSMISIMISRTLKSIDRCCLQKQKINLAEEFSRLTLSIIAACAFGQRTHAEELISRTFTSVIAAIAYRASRLIPLIPLINRLPLWKKDLVDHGTKEMMNFVNEIIIQRRQGHSESLCRDDDLLDLLLSACDCQGQTFTNQEIKDQTLTFILAGHETTSNLLTWIFVEFMKNDGVYRACRDEIDRILPNQTLPTSDNVNDLLIIDAVIRETLRLYPPAPFFARQCVQENTSLGSIHLPIGTTVLVNVYAIHRREDYWPRANEFDYTRWLRDPSTGRKPKSSHPFAYLPFAAGPRNCIGQNFALLETKVMLALLIQRCDFEFEENQTILPEIRITMRPKNGLFARIDYR